MILASVVVVMLDSLGPVSGAHGGTLNVLEWFFTVLFTVEYSARLDCVERPARYARSFVGIVDLLAVLPTYLALFFPGVSARLNVRVLRMLRVFRILKLAAFIREYRALGGRCGRARARSPSSSAPYS